MFPRTAALAEARRIVESEVSGGRLLARRTEAASILDQVDAGRAADIRARLDAEVAERAASPRPRTSTRSGDSTTTASRFGAKLARW